MPLYSHILLIDDDRDDTDIFLEAVDAINTNIECKVENNPIEALEYLKTAVNCPDLIFLDLSMPGMSGNEVLLHIEENTILHKIPIVLFSTHSIDIMHKITSKCKVLKCITKPNSFEDLVNLLREILK